MNLQKHRNAIIATGASIGIIIVGGLVNMVWRKRTQQSDEPAKLPSQLSLSQWREALVEVKRSLGNKNLPILAAGVAYFSTLSFFPMIVAAFAIAAFIVPEQDIRQVTEQLTAYLPHDMANLISGQLQSAAGKHTTNLIAAGVAIAISLYGASGAVRNLIAATNISYGVDESRGLVQRYGVSILLTLGAILASFLFVALIVANAQSVSFLGLPDALVTTVLTLRWVLMAALLTIGLAAFYRYGPDRRNPKWQWVSWGAAFATVIWLIGTVVFFIYAQNFANFGGTYSLFAGIIVLMTWLNLSAFIVLLGAEVNHRIEVRGIATKA